MSECCSVFQPSRTQKICPVDGSLGQPVQPITLKSLLSPAALAHFEPQQSYSFCSSPACEVVYFSPQGQTFTTADVKVPVCQKDGGEDVPVCYCFGWTRQRMRQAIAQSEPIDVCEFISDRVKAHQCGCEVNNPQGRCCLANVRSAIASLSAQ